jgi:hypothetical protein
MKHYQKREYERRKDFDPRFSKLRQSKTTFGACFSRMEEFCRVFQASLTSATGGGVL